MLKPPRPAHPHHTPFVPLTSNAGLAHKLQARERRHALLHVVGE